MTTIDDIDRSAESSNRHRLWLAAAMFAALVAGTWLLPLADWLLVARSFIDAHFAAGALVYILVFVVLTVLMVPGSILIAGGGFLFGLKSGLPLSSLGVALGAGVSALLVRSLARDRLTRRYGDDPRFRAVNAAVARNGFLIVSLTRLSLLMPYNLLNVLYGLSGMRLTTMVLASWVGMTPAVLLYSYLGSVAANVEQLWAGEFGNDWVGTAVVVSGLAMIALATFVIHRTATRALRRELQDG